MKELARRSLPRLAAVTAIACPVFLLGLAVDSMPVRLPAKPWIHLLLIAWVLSSATGRYALRIAAGIALCMVADLLLEFRASHFVHGMALFLCGQLVFASAFTLRCRELRAAAVLPFVIWLSTAFPLMAPGLGRLFVPVVAYMSAIGLMMWRAATWALAESASPASGSLLASRYAVAGAIVFGVSDTMIALDRFHAPIAGARYWIILTYWLALALLAASAARDRQAQA